MAEVPVVSIRQSNRYELNINRKKIKHEENDMRRSLVKGVASVDVSSLASKLKTKSQLSVADLQMLKNLLIEDELNIRLVLNTQGALRGLVREISGVDVNRQVEAAGCLCNLALADLRGCLTIIRAAGAYLVAALDSQNLQLAIVCAWTVGNLCGAGVRASKLMASTGAVGKLCAQLNGESDRMDAAVYALTLLAYAMGDELSEEHLELMVRAVGGAPCGDLRLLHALCCHRAYCDPQRLVERRLSARLYHLVHRHHTECAPGDAQCCDVEYGIRALANMASRGVHRRFLLRLRDTARRQEFLDLLKDPRLRSSMLWLLGNMAWREDHDHSIEQCDDYRPQVPENEVLAVRGEGLEVGGLCAGLDPEPADMSEDGD